MTDGYLKKIANQVNQILIKLTIWIAFSKFSLLGIGAEIQYY